MGGDIRTLDMTTSLGGSPCVQMRVVTEGDSDNLSGREVRRSVQVDEYVSVYDGFDDGRGR